MLPMVVPSSTMPASMGRRVDVVCSMRPLESKAAATRPAFE